MKKFVAVFVLMSMVFLASCDRKPFAEYKLKYDKQSEGCENLSASFKMISNFGGERFKFSKCLPASFDGSQLNVKRAGDTVQVNFPVAGPAGATATFMITLDIDSYPRYNFITIDDETYGLSHSDK